MVDSVSYVPRPRSGLGNYSPPTRFNCLSEQGVGALEECIGLPAFQPVPCLSGSCLGREGHGPLVAGPCLSGSCLGREGHGPLVAGPCLSGSCLGREGHGPLVYKYTGSIGNCATWYNILTPSSC